MPKFCLNDSENRAPPIMKHPQRAPAAGWSSFPSEGHRARHPCGSTPDGKEGGSGGGQEHPSLRRAAAQRDAPGPSSGGGGHGEAAPTTTRGRPPPARPPPAPSPPPGAAQVEQVSVPRPARRGPPPASPASPCRVPRGFTPVLPAAVSGSVPPPPVLAPGRGEGPGERGLERGASPVRGGGGALRRPLSARLGWAWLRPFPPCRYFSPGLAATSCPSPPTAAPGGGGGGSAEPSPRNRDGNRDVPVLRGSRAPGCSSSLRLREPLAEPCRAVLPQRMAPPPLRLGSRLPAERGGHARGMIPNTENAENAAVTNTVRKAYFWSLLSLWLLMVPRTPTKPSPGLGCCALLHGCKRCWEHSLITECQ
ncbi:translation initiation factor IF-2-like [Cygnus atratus]|uniref:translation initiation factor IF-2-like n=1 Tax=Cygnus atratus TaxID=8868 RepID=UPI0021B7B3B6|nr:translation initiation factor IF-2-like [Cygnus atratus]